MPSGGSLVPKFDPKITWGNIIQLAILAVTGLIAFTVLQQKVDAAVAQVVDLKTGLTAVSQSVDTLEMKIPVIERNQVTGREDRENYQEQTTAALEQLRVQNVQILSQLAAITARLDERDRQSRQ